MSIGLIKTPGVAHATNNIKCWGHQGAGCNNQKEDLTVADVNWVAATLPTTNYNVLSSSLVN